MLRLGFVLFLIPYLFPNLAGAGQFKVVEVLAGDFITIERGSQRVDIRLMGIDAPENPGKKNKSRQPYSREATDYLTALVLGKSVKIEHWGKDRYGQEFGVVMLNGENVNLKMVRSGLAEAYRGRMRKDFDDAPYKAAEMEARHRQIGMWSIGNIYISPRVWRKRNR
jgi:endonuclease YncB( thermonuclease family)